MNCVHWEERIALLAGGDLGPSQAAEVELHLAGCAGCQLLLSGLRESMELLREGHAGDVDAAHFAAVRARVLSQLARRRTPFWRRGWVWVAAAASAVVVWGIAERPRGRPNPAAVVVKPATLPAIPVPQAAPPEPDAPVRAVAVTPLPHRGRKTAKPVAPPTQPPETVLVKVETDNPDVVIYWIAETKGEPK